MPTKMLCTCTPPRDGNPASKAGCPLHDFEPLPRPDFMHHSWRGEPQKCVMCEADFSPETEGAACPGEPPPHVP
jgi:hypothetical protein